MTSAKQMIAHAFSQSAVSYDSAALAQQHAARQLIDMMRQYIESDNVGIIADIGCGTAWSAPLLLDCFNAKTYLGVDFAPGMIEIAKSHYHHSTEALWLCDDAENFHLDTESVDIIFSNFSLQWCTDLDSLFQNFYRAISKGGYACFSSLGQKTLQEIKASWQQVDDFPHVNTFYPPKDWQIAFERQGFTLISHQSEVQVEYYGSVRQALNALKIVGANTITQKHRQSLTGKQRFQRFVNAYEKLIQPQGVPVTYDIDYWVLKRSQND